jgi:hypothetical protein
MAKLDFHLMEPPYFQLEEAIYWLEAQIPDSKRDEWWSTLESINQLEDALRRGKLKGYGSVDSAPVQPLAACTWTEFDIHPALSDGQIIMKKGQGNIAGYIVRSSKAYRAAALNDLSQPANAHVPGPGQSEPGYHRVVDQVMFRDRDFQRVFPAHKLAKGRSAVTGKYAKILQEIEGGKYLYSPEPLTLTGVRDLVCDYFTKKRKSVVPQTVGTGLARHYEKMTTLGQ